MATFLLFSGLASILAANEATWWMWGRYRAAEVRRLKAANARLVVELERVRYARSQFELTGDRP